MSKLWWFESILILVILGVLVTELILRLRTEGENQMSKHTKGPWGLVKYGAGFEIRHPEIPTLRIAGLNTGNKVTDNDYYYLDQSELQANAQRIVDCVNALEGFADPSAAPDVLEAAKDAYRLDPMDAYEKLQVAIAKAQGGGE